MNTGLELSSPTTRTKDVFTQLTNGVVLWRNLLRLPRWFAAAWG